jgi:hypothetical protein
MANREVNLTKRIQTPQGMRYCRVVLSANGRVRPDLVLVNGKPETHKEGAYYLEWREGAKRVRLFGWQGSRRRQRPTPAQGSGVKRGKQWRLGCAGWPEWASVGGRSHRRFSGRD